MLPLYNVVNLDITSPATQKHISKHTAQAYRLVHEDPKLYESGRRCHSSRPSLPRAWGGSTTYLIRRCGCDALLPSRVLAGSKLQSPCTFVRVTLKVCTSSLLDCFITLSVLTELQAFTRFKQAVH